MKDKKKQSAGEAKGMQKGILVAFIWIIIAVITLLVAYSDKLIGRNFISLIK